MTEASAYESRSLGVALGSLTSYSDLLGVTSAPTPSDYLRWLYADNPHGNAIGANAYFEGSIVAHYATVPVMGVIDGRRTRGLLSLNTATHPAHQGKGLFTRLAEETYARGAEHGYEFVVGVANANSTPGFIKKLGFQLVAPLDVRVGIGRFTPGTEPVGFSLAWDDPALQWRLQRPHAKYLAAPAGDDTVIVYAHASKLGILAYLTRAPADITGNIPPVKKTQFFRMWIGLDPQLTRSGLLAPVPDSLKPSPLNLIFRDLTGNGRQLDPASTRFTLLDFDAY